MNNKRWLLLFLAVIVLCVAVMLFRGMGDDSHVVTISQNGKTIQTIDLSKVTESYTLRVERDGHYNLLEITPDTVTVLEADCDNQVCVKHGPLAPKGSPITCLPHKLIVSWKKGGAVQ